MAKWMSSLLANSHSEMWKPRVNVTFGDSSLQYGLGWFLSEYQGNRTYWHGGSAVGFSSMILLVPELKIGITVLTNDEDPKIAQTLPYRILDRLIRKNKGSLNALNTKLEKVGQRFFIESNNIETRVLNHHSYGSMQLVQINGITHAKYFSKFYPIVQDPQSGEFYLEYSQGGILNYVHLKIERDSLGEARSLQFDFEPDAGIIEFR